MAGKELLIFNDPVNAWKYGPVIDSIYRQFKDYGSNKINLPNLDAVAVKLDDDAEKVIDGVLLLYGEDDAMSLVNVTHQRSTPWDIVWNDMGGKKHLFAKIPNDLNKGSLQKGCEQSS